jgi:YD repeat-containing protein
MTSIKSRVGTLVLAALAALGFVSPAFAQTSVATPAEKYAINPGGVDMRTGAYIYRQTDLSIGGQGESGGLSLTRMSINPWHLNQPFGNLTHNWDIQLTMKHVSLGTANYQSGSGPDFQVSVHFGGRSKTFNSNVNDLGFTEASLSDFATLTVAGDRATGTYTFTAADGTIAVFRPLSNSDCVAAGTGVVPLCAMISQITETDGTTFTFGYDYNAGAPSNVDRARLKSIVSSRGYGLILEASPATGNLVTKACVINLTLMAMPTNGACPASAQATATYTYISFNGTRLASVTDPAGAMSTFGYSGSSTGYTMAFTKPGQPGPWLTNSVSPILDEDMGQYELVSAQSFADGGSYTYFYDHTHEVTTRTPSFTIAGGRYIDALNQTTKVQYGFPQMPGSKVCKGFNPCQPQNLNNGSVTYQLTSGPIAITDPLTNTTTSDYCDPDEAAVPAPVGGCLVTLLQSFTNPEGDQTFLTYDGNRNTTSVTRHAKPGSGLADITTSSIYDTGHRASSNKPTSVTDAKGNTTSYSYDPVHGGVLTETDPAVNGVTPTKRYAYAQRYAWISNGAGGYIQAATPVWVMTQMSICKNGNPNSTNTGCATAGDEVITTYDYGPDAGPNNLNLHGTVVDAGGLSLRSCVTFDAMGRKISETRPRAGLTSCP